MDISQRGIDLIVSFEGKHKLRADGRYQAYLDTLAKPPVWTLYCGLTRGIREGMICTAEEGDRMFAKELAIFEDAVERLITVPLNENQFAALVSFAYNCGVGALERSTLRKVLNQGKYDQVPAQLMKWVNAGGVKYAGLVRRRAAEGALFMEPMEDKIADAVLEGEVLKAPAMPQRVDEAPAERIPEIIIRSWTIRGAILSFAAWLAQFFIDAYDWLFGVVKEAGPEVIALKTTLSPFDVLIKMTPTLLLAISAIGLGIVVMRRLQAGREGKIG
jgi:lysozyme